MKKPRESDCATGLARVYLAVVLGLVLVATGCGDDGGPTPALIINLPGAREAGELGYETDVIQFEARLSSADSAALGASGTRFQTLPGFSAFAIDTDFGDDVERDPPRSSKPCFVDDLLIVNRNTGEELVAIEAGHCIEEQFSYLVEGAYEYLISAGPCSGTVLLNEGRKLSVGCR